MDWRTSPLLGIGLTKTTNGHTNFLHDGKTRSLEVAIQWDSGKGGKAKGLFRNMNKSGRDELLAFLKNL